MAPYSAAVDTLEVVFTVACGAASGLNFALGGAMLVRSRHQRGATVWRGRPLVAPRLTAFIHLLLGLLFATMALRGVVEPRSSGDYLMLLAETVFSAACIIAGVIWLVVRSRQKARPHQTGHGR